ncbi:hypothetical protein [Myxacorys almedinensis]|uniref:Uncharacterized protein n=1 Tax=Myxacorys almedinensis A TaxID=2690445 RepID=A0A8J7Z1M0_9CYAN|nr:hypothetical protein [Myxacorys almedinensis]NDJ17545.1 hypothetical protein [Myxacorys almedinensis A]
MPEPADRRPAENKKHDAKPEQETVDPMDLVTRGGYEGDPREIVENPAVTPEMLNEPGYLRADKLDED